MWLLGILIGLVVAAVGALVLIGLQDLAEFEPSVAKKPQMIAMVIFIFGLLFAYTCMQRLLGNVLSAMNF